MAFILFVELERKTEFFFNSVVHYVKSYDKCLITATVFLVPFKSMWA